MKNNQVFVLSLGGSLFAPNGIDENFLKKFRRFIIDRIKKDNRFIIITGGGKVCRDYQKSLKAIYPSATKEQLDWMGIHTTRFNAQLVRLMFGSLAHKEVVIQPNIKLQFKEKILLGGGWIPGRSTDDDTVRIAKTYGSKVIINLSNVDYVYTKDPRKFKDAVKIEHMSWKDYRKVVGTTWDPGLNTPFDPIAAKFAEQAGQKVYIANGGDLKNLANILDGKKFFGTVLE